MDLWVDGLEGLSLLSLLETTEAFMSAVTLRDCQYLSKGGSFRLMEWSDGILRIFQMKTT